MHLPGYFSLREISNEANANKTNCLQLHHQEGRIPEKCLDFFRPNSALEFDFEKYQLRQTILKHEIVFQHQLHELHRLYNTQRHMMNEIVRDEKPPHELSVGDFTFCFQQMTRFKNGKYFDESKCKKTWKKSMLDLEVPADRYLDGIGNLESTEVSVDAWDQSFPVHHKNNSGVSVSWLTKSCLLDLNESPPNDERNPPRFYSHIETSAVSGSHEYKGRVFSRDFSGEQGKVYGERAESLGKKKRFGVEISKTSPSSNSCLKIFGFPVLENRHEPQDLPSFSCSSKSGSQASVLLCGTASDKVGTLNTDHMLSKHEEKQSVDGFSDSLASVLSYGANSSKVDSLNTDHVFRKVGVNQSVKGLAIDLNMCAEEGKQEEEEEKGVQIVSSTRNNDSRKLEIDLEAPREVEQETSGAECESCRDKPVNESVHGEEDSKALAAEALLHISLSRIDDSKDNYDLLSWFADVISSQEAPSASMGKNITFSKDFSQKEVDYFEYMTLKQPEITVEEYNNIMWENENPKDKNMYKNLRQRRHSRRGRKRKRKDFQRDVLPKLTSLSRKEVRDDLQAIEDLVRVAGETWESGSTRMEKTGSGRGHKPLVCGEIGFEGRGKRTRRPPRQRCVNGFMVIASK